MGELSDHLNINKRAYEIIYYNFQKKLPVSEIFTFDKEDDESELYYALCDRVDDILKLDFNESMFFNMSRDNETEKAIIVRIA